jgi:hypothetical protein
VNGFRLYFDEDTSSTRLIEALRTRNIDLVSAFEAGLNAHSDEEQLLWAANAGRVIYTFNAKHFCQLHREFLEAGRDHAGIIVGQQQRFSIGEQLRRMLRVLNARSSEEMRNHIEFLGNWN